MITCHIGAFCFDARQFGAFHFGDFHFAAVPVRRVSLWRASTSARFSLARFPILYLSCILGYLIICFLSARVFCEEVWSTQVLPRSHSTRLTFAYHFLHVFTLCVIYLLIISTRQRWLHHSELVYLRWFFWCLVHTFINHFRNIFIREDQGEVITSAGLKQVRVGEHSTPR